MCPSAERRGEGRNYHWPKTVRAQGLCWPRLKAVLCDTCVRGLVDFPGPVFKVLAGAFQETGSTVTI